MGGTKPIGQRNWYSHDVYLWVLHPIHVPQPNVLRVPHHEQPGASTASRPGPHGHRMLRHGIYTVPSLQFSNQGYKRGETINCHVAIVNKEHTYVLLN